MKKVLHLEEIEKEFMETEGNFEIKVINFSFVNDCNYDDYTLEIEIFGTGDNQGLFGESPVVEYAIDLEGLLTSEDHFQGIDKQKIPSLFSPQLLAELVNKNTRIEWNRGDETEELIDLSNPGEGYLLAMVR